MKKTGKWIILGMISLFFCACGTETTNDDVEHTHAPSTSQEVISETSIIGEEFPNIERLDWSELICYADEETSRHNSNFLNYGYLTYDEDGNIYYRNLNNNDFYVSDYKGENKRLLFERDDYSGWMRLSGEWLYYTTENTAIMRFNLSDGKVEQIKEEFSGHFRLEEEKLYWDDWNKEGFSMSDPDGQNEKLVQDTSLFYVAFFSCGNEFWIAEAVSKANENDKNYLLIMNEEKLMLLNQKGVQPLLAGKYISVLEGTLGRRHIWNTETKEDINLNVYTDQTIVSDGNIFYYKEMKQVDALSRVCIIHKWDGQTTEEIWRFDADSLYHMFITPKGLYCMPQVKEGSVYKHQLLFYDFETGEKIQIY